MSTAIAPMEEKPRLNADEAGLIVTGGNAPGDHHELADWFRDLRFEGWETFGRTAAPVRTDEAWRFASIKSLDLSTYKRPQPVEPARSEELVARSRALAETAGRMVFANDTLLRRDVYGDALKQRGVIFAPLHEAVGEHAEILRAHFMAQEVVLGSKKFAALHQAWVTSGTFLYVPANVELALPLEAFHWLDGDNGSIFPHTLIVLGDNARATFLDHFESSAPDTRGFACGVNDLIVGRGAQLTYVNVQNWGRQAVAVQINSTVVGRDASAMSMNLNLGASYARTESVSRLLGEGGRSDMLAVSVTDETQEMDQRTLQDHRQPGTASDLLYKNSLHDKARTIFAGLIRVEPGAHRTDAYQKVRNMLLSDDAEANSMPGLEIMADDVRCTHGATSGQIDEEELFYLLARGIAKRQAQELIVFGFLNEVIERLKQEPVAELLRAKVQARFAGEV